MSYWCLLPNLYFEWYDLLVQNEASIVPNRYLNITLYQPNSENIYLAIYSMLSVCHNCAMIIPSGTAYLQDVHMISMTWNKGHINLYVIERQWNVAKHIHMMLKRGQNK